MGKGRHKSTWPKTVRLVTTDNEEPAALSCPAHLGKIAKAEFRRIVKQLVSDKVELVEGDATALAMYANAYEHWVTAEANLATEGYTIAAPNGMTRQNPNMPISNEAVKTMERIGQQFGLTPMSRKKLNKEDGETKPVANEFLNWQAGGKEANG